MRSPSPRAATNRHCATRPRAPQGCAVPGAVAVSDWHWRHSFLSLAATKVQRVERTAPPFSPDFARRPFLGPHSDPTVSPLRFRVLLTPRQRCFSAFSHDTYSLSVSLLIFSIGRELTAALRAYTNARDSVSLAQWAPVAERAGHRAITFSGVGFHRTCQRSPTTRSEARTGRPHSLRVSILFVRFPLHSPLLRESMFLSFHCAY